MDRRQEHLQKGRTMDELFFSLSSPMKQLTEVERYVTLFVGDTIVVKYPIIFRNISILGLFINIGIRERLSKRYYPR